MTEHRRSLHGRRQARPRVDISERSPLFRRRCALDALRATADTYRAYAHAHPGLYAALQRAPDELGGEYADAARELVEVVVAVISGYGLQGDDAIHGVRIVRSALHGFVSLEQLGGFAIDLSLDATFERLVAMLDLALSEGYDRR